MSLFIIGAVLFYYKMYYFDGYYFMKDAIKNFISFTRTEQRGIIALGVIIALLLSVRITMKFWVKPPSNNATPQLLAAWNDFKINHTDHAMDEVAVIAPENIRLFTFDPNTLDSTGFITIGLRPKTTHMLLNWRRKGKIFYKKEDLKPLYTLTEAEYNRIVPFIAINNNNHSAFNNNKYPSFYKDEPLPATIDLNKADSSLIVRLRGIGPTLAHKIVTRRNALGGFIKHEQLLELYKFPDTVFAMLKEKLVINPASVRKIKLNTASEDEMKTHPYIGEKVAKNIILYREGLKKFNNIGELRQVPLMNEEIYRKIAPYFTLD